MHFELEADAVKKQYIRRTQIWGVTAAMTVNADDLAMNSETEERIFSITEEVREYLEGSRTNIEQIILDNGYLSAANRRADLSVNRKGMLSSVNKLISAFGKNKEKTDEEVKYLSPVTEEEFRKSLYIDEIALYPDCNFDYSDQMEIYVVCKPDYLKGHAIEIILNTDGTADEIRLFG